MDLLIIRYLAQPEALNSINLYLHYHFLVCTLTSPSMPGSPPKPAATGAFQLENQLTKRTIMDAFNKSTYFPKDPEIGFGTAARPNLNEPNANPGPGSYPIKTTMKKTMQSNIHSPESFSLRSRHKFGDPNERALSKTSANEPGPSSYDLNGRFIGGSKAPEYSFPKGNHPHDKSNLSPAPGSYEVIGAFGKQPLSTKHKSNESPFPKAPRPGLVQVGGADVGPGAYGAPRAACEPQVESRKVTCGSIKIGTGYKKGSAAAAKGMQLSLSEPSPGPGSYVLPGGVATQQKGTPFRNSPKISMSGREAFGSPFR